MKIKLETDAVVGLMNSSGLLLKPRSVTRMLYLLFLEGKYEEA